jgi:diacylglycerol kinase (ATP)
VPKPGDTGFIRVVRATGYSWLGFKAAWRNESAFRQECVLGLLMFPLAFVVGKTLLEVLLLICVLALVLITELLNSAVEAVVDRIGMDHHELSGRAKDMGSAAVFVSLCLVVLVWATALVKNFLLS